MLKATESNRKEKLTLVIETAIAGGSLALFKDDRLIGEWKGGEEISKSEDVLEQIDKLLKINEIKKTRLDLIKVFRGQGSATGLKIGLAIAKGLSDALRIRLAEISTAEVMLSEADPEKEKVLIALPSGKNLFLCFFYKRDENGNLRIVQESVKAKSLVDFQKLLESANYEQIIFHSKAYKIFNQSIEVVQKLNLRIRVVSENPASLAG